MAMSNPAASAAAAYFALQALADEDRGRVILAAEAYLINELRRGKYSPTNDPGRRAHGQPKLRLVGSD